MTALSPHANVAELARWLRVEEGGAADRVELASAWQRQPDDSPNRTVARIVCVVLGLMLALLFLQAALTNSPLTLAVAFTAIGALFLGAWRIRPWFWRTVVDVDDSQITVSRRGWGAPCRVSLDLDSVRALAYRIEAGQLNDLALEHTAGRLALPYSGQHDLDKLYCNILRHLLQKRRPTIRFSALD